MLGAMFLEELHVENYRCLRDVTLKFAPLTVLVGPNGSGKTAVLSALASPLWFRQADAWRHENVQLRRTAKGEGLSFDEVVSPDAASRQRWSHLSLALRPSALRESNVVVEAFTLEPSGANLVNVFATLPRVRRQAVAERLCELVPLYRDVDSRPIGEPHAGKHRLVFEDRWTPGLWFDPGEVSDGTMVLLAFLVLTHLERPPDLVTIEHPEEALHPYLLQQVIGMLRALATGGLGPKAVQVVVTTHSPLLLDFVEPSEVRFLARNLESGAATVREAPTDSDQWRAAFDEYEESLGEMWLAGGLGGVPPMPADQ